MYNNPHRCVIDANNHYVEFVLTYEDGSIESYELKEGETLIEAPPPLPLESGERPRWTGTEWTPQPEPVPFEDIPPPEPTGDLETQIRELQEKIAELEDTHEFVAGMMEGMGV